MTKQSSRILVIEDDNEIRGALEDLLPLHGYVVVAAESGQAGLVAPLKHLPDLIVCDVMMPGMTGFEVLDLLRRNSRTDTIPFIFLTARSERQDVRQGMSLGAEDYITKPFSEKELIDSVKSRLQRREMVQSLVQRQMADLRSTVKNAMSHELLTPLNGILGFAALMCEGADTISRDEIREWSKLIKQSGERQHDLIKKVLAHAEIELRLQNVGNEEKPLEPFAVKPLIETVVRKLAERAERTADVRMEVASAVLKTDAGHYELLVRELVDNALKFSTGGQSVEVTGRSEKGRYLLVVTDQGRGMSAEQIEQIGPYRQFDRKKYEQQGLGLGLATARKITDLWGGTLVVTPGPGNTGLRVCVMIPGVAF